MFVGGLWCCLVSLCTVVARCSCWAVTARDCQDRDVRIHHGRTSQHQSVVVAQWTSPSAVDRDKGGELAYLAGDTLEEAIGPADRVSVGSPHAACFLGLVCSGGTEPTTL